MVAGTDLAVQISAQELGPRKAAIGQGRKFDEEVVPP